MFIISSSMRQEYNKDIYIVYYHFGSCYNYYYRASMQEVVRNYGHLCDAFANFIGKNVFKPFHNRVYKFP